MSKKGGPNGSNSSESISDNKIYLATARSVPIIGKKYSCTRIVFIDGQLVFTQVSTPKVKKIEFLGDGTYKVTTPNSIYFTKVCY